MAWLEVQGRRPGCSPGGYTLKKGSHEAKGRSWAGLVQILWWLRLAKLSGSLFSADVTTLRQTPGTGGWEAELAPGCPCTAHLPLWEDCTEGVQTWSSSLAGLSHHPQQFPTWVMHQGPPRRQHPVAVTLTHAGGRGRTGVHTQTNPGGAAIATPRYRGGFHPFRRGPQHTVMGTSMAPALLRSGHRLPSSPRLCQCVQCCRAVRGPRPWAPPPPQELWSSSWEFGPLVFASGQSSSAVLVQRSEYILRKNLQNKGVTNKEKNAANEPHWQWHYLQLSPGDLKKKSEIKLFL